MNGRLCGAVLLVTVALAAVHLTASGGGILTFGSPVPAAVPGGSHRHLVHLDGVGSVLRGMPSTGEIAMITIRTPDAARPARAVIWERHTEDGSSLVQISVPAWLEQSMLGATLFFRRGAETASVAQAHDGRWVDLAPVVVDAHFAPAGQTGRPALIAYPVEKLGFFVRHRLQPSGSRTYPDADPAAMDTGARVARAAWHFLWPTLALAALMVLSKRRHEREER
jgi:hypothetical protein